MMMQTISLLVLALFTASGSAFNTEHVVDRRDAFKSVISGTATLGSILAVTQPANAINACPPRSSNCIRTTWTPPAGTSKSNIVKAVKGALEGYPQEGQAGVDLGGWAIVEDNLDAAGTARVEYKSGIGKFAKFFNGGKPFVDDLVVELTGDGKAVEIRSASRVGDSDFDVNKKRLTFLAGSLRTSGWTVPDPSY